MALHTFFLATSVLLLTIYVLWLAGGHLVALLDYRRASQWAREVVADVQQHLPELRAKRRHLIEDKGYGVSDDSRWQEEIVAFVSMVLIGQRRRRFDNVAAENEFVRLSAGVVERLAADAGRSTSIDIGQYVDDFLPSRKRRVAVQWGFAIVYLGAAALLLQTHSWWAAALASLAGLVLVPPLYRRLTQAVPWLGAFGIGWIVVWILAVLSLIASNVHDGKRRAELEAIEAARLHAAQLDAQRKAQLVREAADRARKAQEENAREMFGRDREAILQQLALAIKEERLADAESTLKQFSVVQDEELIRLANSYALAKAAHDKRVAEEKTRLAKEQAERDRQKHYDERIPAYAIDKYTSKGYPNLVRKYRSRLPEIESLRRTAAEMAVDSKKCDYVENVQLSDQSQLRSLVFFLDCRNQNRIYLTEVQIRNREPVKTEAEKAWREGDAIIECRSMIRARALIPSSVDFHTFTGTSARTVPSTGNVVVNINYDASNAFGVEIGYRARCIFPPEKPGEIEIFLR